MSDRNGWAPAEVGPGDIGTDATPEALVAHLDAIDLDALLVREKAVVFRGFKVPADGLDPVLDRLLPRRLAYVHGNSPRTKVGSNVYTSTEYPQEYTISMHNEMSYAHAWPTRLTFYCAVAPATGGATPVVDAALWLESLDDEVREAFRSGVRYTQNLHGGRGLGKSWQDTFETEDRDEVDAFLKEADADWSWGPGNSLMVSQVRHSTVRHPDTGTEVWFNQSDQWHPASLGDETAKALAQIMPASELPQYVTFADGSPIPDAYVLQVRDRGLENAVDVDWHEGDLLVIDNLLVGHGRRPFTGPRRVLVAMSD
ncbi:putative Clavaminate synthase-like protein [Streptomyces afghaniensis 772]|uniref:Putative Clavaminate synthase-like protein n=1 Tax=Streptomyces afghaniensis 772 TaxID=1283301 RepID=S4MQT8_9ACTN|nr:MULTISPECIES: TauD/TfdA family dioxygenase [Streptomyces]EPJ35812.1 putative Clavaminate synthase-like protein [Streptomyces afghaniensis 772]UOB11385.1 TauD/TfdA family dioxygenase [Streptomyces sp. HP-A2021]